MRGLAIGAGLAVLGLAGAAAAWAFSPDFAIGQLQAYVAERTARSLTVSGGAHVEFSPSLAIRLDDVTLSNPQGMEGQFVSARSLSLPIAYADLMQRQLPVGRVTLADANFNFVIDGEGRANWTEAGGKSDKNGSPLQLVLENAAAAFLDQRHGQAFALREIDAAAEVSEAGEVTLRGSTVIAGQRAKFETYVKSPARAAGEGSPATLSFESPLIKVSFDGRLAAKGGLGLAGQVSATAADLRAAARWLGATPGGERGFKNFTLTGKLDSEGKTFKLRQAEIGFDSVKGTGVAILDFGKPMPAIAVSLETGSIDLNPYLTPKPAVASEPAEAAAAWDRTPLGFAALRGLDIKAELKAKKLFYGAIETGPATIEARLANGRLYAHISGTEFYGGKADARILLDGAGGVPALDLTFSASGVKARDFFNDFSGLDRIDGTASLTAVVNGSGNTEQEMVSTLEGAAAIGVDKGGIRGLDAAAMAAAVRDAPLSGWPLQESSVTKFDSLSAEAGIADGIVSLSELKLDGAAIALTGKGEVDLLRRDLDLAIKAEPAGAEATLIKITGPWGRPKLAEADQPKAAAQAGKSGIARKIDKAVDDIATSRPVQSVKRGTKKLYRKLFGN
ncbi:MAG: AsmA family protein [Hyphomicrobiales bacterium]